VVSVAEQASRQLAWEDCAAVRETVEDATRDDEAEVASFCALTERTANMADAKRVVNCILTVSIR